MPLVQEKDNIDFNKLTIKLAIPAGKLCLAWTDRLLLAGFHILRIYKEAEQVGMPEEIIDQAEDYNLDLLFISNWQEYKFNKDLERGSKKAYKKLIKNEWGAKKGL